MEEEDVCLDVKFGGGGGERPVNVDIIERIFGPSAERRSGSLASARGSSRQDI